MMPWWPPIPPFGPWAWSVPVPPWAAPMIGPFLKGLPSPLKEQVLSALRQQADFLRAQLEELERAIKELEQG